MEIRATGRDSIAESAVRGRSLEQRWPGGNSALPTPPLLPQSTTASWVLRGREAPADLWDLSVELISLSLVFIIFILS